MAYLPDECSNLQTTRGRASSLYNVENSAWSLYTPCRAPPHLHELAGAVADNAVEPKLALALRIFTQSVPVLSRRIHHRALVEISHRRLAVGGVSRREVCRRRGRESDDDAARLDDCACVNHSPNQLEKWHARAPGGPTRTERGTTEPRNALGARADL